MGGGNEGTLDMKHSPQPPIPHPMCCAYCNTPQLELHEMGKSQVPPAVGDIFLCPNCGEVSVKSLTLGWVQMTDSQWAELAPHEVQSLKEAMQAIQYHKLEQQQKAKHGFS